MAVKFDFERSQVNVLVGDLIVDTLGNLNLNWGKLQRRDQVPLFDRRYFGSRLKDKRYRDKPVNHDFANRLIDVFRLSMSEGSDYNAGAVHDSLVVFLEKACEADFSYLRIKTEDGYEEYSGKALEALDLIQALLSAMIGEDELNPDDAFDVCLKKGARAERRNETDFNNERYEREGHYFGYDHGVERFFFNVTDTNYPVRISKAQHQIDIVHFHGLSWTNQNREFLTKAMRQTDLKLRVILLDPESDFVEPYAHFIGVKPEYLKEKTDEVTKIWIQMHTALLIESKEACEFELIYDKGFPAKAMYRFDNSIIVTPTTNAGPKAQFMAYECLEMPGNESSAFSIIEKEIEWLASTGKIVWPPQRPDEAAY